MWAVPTCHDWENGKCRRGSACASLHQDWLPPAKARAEAKPIDCQARLTKAIDCQERTEEAKAQFIKEPRAEVDEDVDA